MSSDLAKRIAAAKKELAALKAGFASGQFQWKEATLTVVTFDVTYDSPQVITANFAEPDFPLLFTDATNIPSGTHVINLAMRKGLYQWHIHNFNASVHQSILCTLLSWRPPISLTIGDE